MSLKKIKHLKMRRGKVDLRWHKNCAIEPDNALRSSHQGEHRHGEAARSAAGRFGRQFKMQRAMIKRLGEAKTTTPNDGNGLGLVQLDQKESCHSQGDARAAGATARWPRHLEGTLWKGRCRTHARMRAGLAELCI